MTVNEITEAVIGAAIEVHRALGPGLLESAYQHCLAYELKLLGIPFECEQILPVEYKGTKLAYQFQRPRFKRWHQTPSTRLARK